MKTIGITLRHENCGKHEELRDNLDTRWYSFFRSLHILPILLPNDVLLCQNILEKTTLDGFLMTGGPDHPLRCEVENFLIGYAINHALPLIGVCHGMQMIQRYFKMPLEAEQGHVCPIQTIMWKNQSRTVNSYHTLGTTQIHSDFKRLGYFPQDGVIKALQHKSYKILGIMWHPERFLKPQNEDLELFKHFYTL